MSEAEYFFPLKWKVKEPTNPENLAFITTEVTDYHKRTLANAKNGTKGTEGIGRPTSFKWRC